MIKNVQMVVKGLVQGVGFRHSTRRAATTHQIFGWVRNDEDGSVRIEAEAEEASLLQFISWCKKGPAQAAVTEVQITEGVVKGFSEFEVRR